MAISGSGFLRLRRQCQGGGGGGEGGGGGVGRTLLAEALGGRLKEGKGRGWEGKKDKKKESPHAYTHTYTHRNAPTHIHAQTRGLGDMLNKGQENRFIHASIVMYIIKIVMQWFVCCISLAAYDKEGIPWPTVIEKKH